jgi:hypothetical protein
MSTRNKSDKTHPNTRRTPDEEEKKEEDEDDEEYDDDDEEEDDDEAEDEDMLLLHKIKSNFETIDEIIFKIKDGEFIYFPSELFFQMEQIIYYNDTLIKQIKNIDERRIFGTTNSKKIQTFMKLSTTMNEKYPTIDETLNLAEIQKQLIDARLVLEESDKKDHKEMESKRIQKERHRREELRMQEELRIQEELHRQEEKIKLFDVKDKEFYDLNNERKLGISEESRIEHLSELRRQLEVEAYINRKLTLKQYQHIINTDKSDAAEYTNTICYVLIACHGVIDIDHIIRVPIGKEIIKKNTASCGYRYMHTHTTKRQKNEVYPRWLNELIENFDTCGDTKLNVENIHDTAYQNRYLNFKTFGHIPNMKYDPYQKPCSIMKDKLQYYNKYYQLLSTEIDTIKSVPLRGITVCINRETYNIMHKKDLDKLIDTYLWYINLRTYRQKQLTKLTEQIAELPLLIDEEDIKVYEQLTTSFLFSLFYLLPFNTFKILDASCHTVKTTDPTKMVNDAKNLLHPSFVDYHYSDLNPIGFGGGYIKSKHTKSKKHNKRRYNNIKTARFKNKILIKSNNSYK